MKKQSDSAAQKKAADFIEVQKVAATALRINNMNRVDAMAWLGRDWERAMALIVAEPGKGATESPKMRLAKEAIEYISSHPKWDGAVQYELVRSEVK